ncbi:MAG: cytochrome c oxidase accessory protein CcoG [Proteobacteria bacterium]|nr:cytochrome c oxidase accessory protein CcoG [Pseudomonadota bacterium]
MRSAAANSVADSAAAEPEAQPLYADRVRVYPRSVSGFYRRIKWLLLVATLGIYYLVPWLRWDRGPATPDQAILIDLPGRRAYFFFVEIWPQEAYYLTGLLILAAISLFLATSLLGRVWCGYACPQTVWTDLFMWMERLIEGDRVQRMRLDAAPLSAGKLVRKTAKHVVWLMIALATGGAWVMYFNDAPTVVREALTLQASTPIYFFIGLFTVTTYLLAGLAREQVCTYMCPWPRIQAAMLDEHSLIVTYRRWRGEPRGKHKQGASWEGRGDCVDCQACVQVCPTGIDIRDGQQLECIGCGLCIDACDDIMAKVGRPTGLIAFDTLVNQERHANGQFGVYKLLRARTIVYGLVLAGVLAVMLVAWFSRSTAELTVLRDRAPLFVQLSDGGIRNSYTIKVLNKTHAAQIYDLAFEGLPGARLSLTGESNAEAVAGRPVELAMRADTVGTFRVHLRMERSHLKGESIPVAVVLRSRNGESATHPTVFLGPKEGIGK